jgi:hypothetical protein
VVEEEGLVPDMVPAVVVEQQNLVLLEHLELV